MYLKTLRFFLILPLFGASLLAEEDTSEVEQVEPIVEEVAPPPVEATPAELNEVLGYLTALGGGIGSLQLDEEAIVELADGLNKALKGEIEITSLPQAEVEKAFGEAQARAEAVQSAAEELPAFGEGSLEKIGALICMQSGIQQLGFGAEDADDIRKGFIAGATATGLTPEIEAKMPAFQAMIEGRMQIAQAAALAEQEKAREAAMAEFKPIAAEWGEKENVSIVLETTQGEVEVELYPKSAPLAVANFVGHVESGYYDGIIFHRVIDGFMIQGGDPLGSGIGGESIWGKPFPDEFTEELRFDTEGLLAMANSGPMTNGSQFFITTGKPDWLNDKHTIFGKVVSGYDNVVKIEKTETGEQDKPVAEQKIVKAYLKK